MALNNTQDALGGSGSISTALQAIAVNGLSRAVDGYFARKYPLTSFNETLTVNAEGEVKPSGAPQANVSPTQTLRDFFAQPVVIAVGAALLVTTVLIFAARR